MPWPTGAVWAHGPLTPSNCLSPLKNSVFCEVRSFFLPHSISSLLSPFCVSGIQQSLSSFFHNKSMATSRGDEGRTPRQELPHLYNSVPQLTKGKWGSQEKPYRAAQRGRRHNFFFFFLLDTKFYLKPGSTLRIYGPLNNYSISWNFYFFICKMEIKEQMS